MSRDYRDLMVWQKAMEVAKQTYILVRKLPREETYALSDQMRRAVVSIPSNIAEGQARNSTKEFVHFLSVANGSRTELETQLLLCVSVGYFSEIEIIDVMTQLQEIGKMLNKLSSKLTTNN